MGIHIPAQVSKADKLAAASTTQAQSSRPKNAPKSVPLEEADSVTSDIYISSDDGSGLGIVAMEEEEDEKEEEEESSPGEEDEPPKLPQKRKNVNHHDDTGHSRSKVNDIQSIQHLLIFLSSEKANRARTPDKEEEVIIPQITYTMTIFSLAELAKPHARRQPKVRFVILASDLEWLDVRAQLKIKAVDVLFPNQAAVDDEAI